MLGKHLLGLYEKALPKNISWKSRLETAKDLGFDFVEISIDEDDDRLTRLDWTFEHRKQLLSDIVETGMPIRSMCLSGHRRYPFGSKDEQIQKKAYELMEKAIVFADFMGIRVIQLAGYDVYYEPSTDESKQAFLDGLKWSCELAAKYGVMLAMEIMDTPFLNSISKNLWYKEQLKSPWYATYPDIGNLTAWGNDVEAELSKGIDNIVSVHLKDTLAVTEDFDGKFKGVPFGQGCVDFSKAFKTLERLKFTGPYLMEMWTDTNQDDIKTIKRAKAFIEGQYRLAMVEMKSEA